MRTTSLKSIYLTKEELKEAIADFLSKKGENTLVKHLKNFPCDMEWCESSKTSSNPEFTILIDGEIQDELPESTSLTTLKNKKIPESKLIAAKELYEESGNIEKASRIVGISRSTLYRYLSKNNLEKQ